MAQSETKCIGMKGTRSNNNNMQNFIRLHRWTKGRPACNFRART